MKDIVIIGGGPAGLSAAIYAARYLLDTVVVAENLGGALIDSPQVENYPGFKSMSGYELMKKLQEHVKEYNVPLIEERVVSATREGDHFVVKTNTSMYPTKSIILATGLSRLKLKAKNVSKFEGRGISYCATCDAALFKDKVVAVIGGGDAGVGSALLLSDYAKKVYLIEISNKLTAEPIKKRMITRNKKIEVLTKTRVVEVRGDNWVESIVLDSGRSIPVNGVFVEIGGKPNSKLANELGVKLNKCGEVVIDNRAETNVPGVFAAGDVTNVPFKQAIVSAGHGAIAAWSAYRYITNLI